VIFSCYPNAIKFVIIAILFCGLIEALYGISQLLGLNNSKHVLYRMTGTFFNPGPYGGYLSVIMTLSISYIVSYNAWITYHVKYINNSILWFKHPVVCTYFLSCTAFVISFVIFFALMSRAAILAFAVSSLLSVVANRIVRNKISDYIVKRRMKTLFLVLISIVLIVLFTYYLYNTKKESADGRVLIWKNTISMIHEHPFWGNGIGTYCGNYAKIQAEYFRTNPNSDYIYISGSPEYGFNEYLQTGSEFGLVGMLFFITILLISVYKLLNIRNILGFGLLALMVFAFFSYPLSLLPFQILLIIFVAAAGSTISSQNNTKKRKIASIVIFSILLFIVVYYGNVYSRKISATIHWGEIQHYYREGHYDDVMKDYERLYEYINDNPRFLFEYGYILNKMNQYEASILVLNKGALLSSDPMFMCVIGNNYKSMGLLENSEKSYILAYQILPNRMYPLYLLMKLYEDSSQETKAVNMAKMILSFNSKVESSATKEMKEEAKSLFRVYNDSINIKTAI
jgi:O-antigen ligase